MPHVEMNPAAIMGSIAAVIGTVLALLFGASFFGVAVPQVGSIGQGPNQFTVKEVVLPEDAQKADAAKVEKLLRAGLQSVTYRNQSVSMGDVDPNFTGHPKPVEGYPFRAGGFDGCNSSGGYARITADGVLEFAKGTTNSTTVGCSDPAANEYDKVVRSGMEVYTLGNRIFLKHEDNVLEFAPSGTYPRTNQNGSTNLSGFFSR